MAKQQKIVQQKEKKSILDFEPGHLTAIARHVAEQHAMAGVFTFLPDGSKLYRVNQGWESDALSKSPDVRVCNTILSLEAAFRDVSTPVILIEQNALLTANDIAKVSERTNAVKTLFKVEKTA